MYKTITIDLKEYGYDGIIVMAPPTVNKKLWVQSKITQVNVDNSGMKITPIKSEYTQIYVILSYIRDAPFGTEDPKAFLSFFDKLDDELADRLFIRITQEITNITNGVCSPLQTSSATVTHNSEVVSL